MPGSGLPIEPGRISIDGIVGDHDAAGFGLPPIVVNRQAQRFSPQTTASGLSGSPTLWIRRSALRSYFSRGSTLHSHQAADRRRRGVPDGDLLVLQNAIPALGVEVGFIDDVGHAVQQRRDDAVRRAGYPARIGRAPEDVVRDENRARTCRSHNASARRRGHGSRPSACRWCRW